MGPAAQLEAVVHAIDTSAKRPCTLSKTAAPPGAEIAWLEAQTDSKFVMECQTPRGLRCLMWVAGGESSFSRICLSGVSGGQWLTATSENVKMLKLKISKVTRLCQVAARVKNGRKRKDCPE
jgi:hypothetical protein